MSTTRQSPAEGTTTVNILFFITTLPRTSKSHDIFKLRSLCKFANRVEAYEAQTGLAHCYNCQKFGDVWATCKQLSRCVWCGGGHLHKECMQKGNTVSIRTCSNCKLVGGEEPELSKYRGCRHAKEEMPKGKSQRATKPHHLRTIPRGDATQQHSNSSSFSRPQLHRPAPPPLEVQPTRSTESFQTLCLSTTCSNYLQRYFSRLWKRSMGPNQKKTESSQKLY
jgi:hypothetical protein